MARNRKKKRKYYLFSELDQEHQRAVVANLGRGAAKKTVWRLMSDFPVDQAAAIAWDTSLVIHDRDVESEVAQIEILGEVRRPVLIDQLHALDVEDIWMEGKHRAIASEKLGLKTIPALVRIE